MKYITSSDNPFYKELGKIATSSRQRGKSGITLLDGAHLLAGYLASGKRPLHLVLNAAALHNVEIAGLLAKLPDVPQTQLDDALFDKLTELKTPSGILALIAIPRPIVTPQSCRFCLLLESIQDPGNLGSILRSAAAAGCDAVFMSTGCADAWSPKVLRAGMGGHFVLSIQEQADMLSIATSFTGIIYSASLSAQTSLYASRLTGKVAFAIGNEGAGLTQALLASTTPVTIPMPGQIESLNAAAAAAVCLFEAVRQRGAHSHVGN